MLVHGFERCDAEERYTYISTMNGCWIRMSTLTSDSTWVNWFSRKISDFAIDLIATYCPDCRCCPSLTRPNVPVPKVVDCSKSRLLYFSRAFGIGRGNKFCVGLTADDLLVSWSSTEERLVGAALILCDWVWRLCRRSRVIQQESNCVHLLSNVWKLLSLLSSF